MSESQSRVSFKKQRTLSNEDFKLANQQSEFATCAPGAQQQNLMDYNKNQISVQNNSLTVNLGKGNYFAQDIYNANKSCASSKVSTVDSSNGNSDVEIIEDDYAKTLQNIPGFYHSKSTVVGHQTTSDVHSDHGHHHHHHDTNCSHHHHHHKPFGLNKMHSTFTNCQRDSFSDEASGFAGEATRKSQNKKF